MITEEKAPLSTQGPCFQLKGSLLPFTVLELLFYSYTEFNQRLAKLVKQAPGFFRDTPIVINLEKLPEQHEVIDFIELTEVCQAFGIYPIAIKGGNESQQMAALVAGLPAIPANPTQKLRQLNQEKTQEAEKPTEAPPVVEKPVPIVEPAATKIVTQPVRSGQQVYAPGGDLIVLASVGAGAEILADGNIHVYGPLRGRALAGVKGNTKARIFCQRLEAELLSIAGRYKIDEDLKKMHWREAVQASLSGNQLKISCLSQ